MAGWKSTTAAAASVVPLLPFYKKSVKCEARSQQPQDIAVSQFKEMDVHLRRLQMGEQVRCHKMQNKAQEASNSEAIASICKENDIYKSQATKDKQTVEDLQTQAAKDKETVEGLQSQVQLAETEKAALRTSIKEKDAELEKGKSERRLERLLATSKYRARQLQPLHKSVLEVANIADTMLSKNAKQVQYKETCDEICWAIKAVFVELKKEGVDVEGCPPASTRLLQG